MPRFLTRRDYEFIQHINRELIDETMDTPVILFKIMLTAANLNIYGEATKKPRYSPVMLNCIIKYDKNTQSTESGIGSDQFQQVEFRFQRRMLQEVNVYPDVGDIVKYNNLYYEINNVTETQLIAGKPEYNAAVICEAHLTRKTALDIEDNQV